MQIGLNEEEKAGWIGKSGEEEDEFGGEEKGVMD